MSDRVKQTQRIETVQQYNTCHQDRHYYLQVVSTFTQRYSRVYAIQLIAEFRSKTFMCLGGSSKQTVQCNKCSNYQQPT